MESLLDSIRIAMRDGASDDERRRGIAACYGLAHALEGSLGARGAATLRDVPPSDGPTEVVVPEVVSPDELAHATFAQDEPRAPHSLTAWIASQAPGMSPPAPRTSNPFAGMTADQVLDLIITRLRGAVGDSAPPPPAGQPFRLTLVPVPRAP